MRISDSMVCCSHSLFSSVVARRVKDILVLEGFIEYGNGQGEGRVGLGRSQG